MLIQPRSFSPRFTASALAAAATVLSCGGNSNPGTGGFGAYDAGGPDTGASSASLVAVGSDANGSVTVGFSGAATQESVPGVYCKLWSSMYTSPFLEVLGTTRGDLSSAEIKLWDFALSAGESRKESFTSSQMSASISATLIGTSSGFMYDEAGLSGGSCTTTITALMNDFVAGTFDCNPLPSSQSGGTQSLSLTFSCPLQP
jgi:hypothetical protein